MFRGFNKRSGGNSNLNSPTAITPHAFYGIPKDIQDDSWIGSTIRATFGPRRQFSPPKPVRFQAMPWWQLRKEICDHLAGDKKVNSHFSSWTADLQTAMAYANHGPSPHIGVLDTQKRHDDNKIMHVIALWEAGLSNWKYRDEYLVYGPVQGKSYTCMTLAWQIYPTDLLFNLWIMLSPETQLAHTLQALNRTARHSFYRAGDTWLRVLLGMNGGWPLILTVIAAEWGRSKTNAHQDHVVMRRVKYPRLEEMKAVISGLSWFIEQAARSPDVVLPIYNPDTYRTYLPGVDYMLSLLRQIEYEITRRRSKPQPEPFSLIGYFWPQTSGQNRKASKLEAAGDSDMPQDTKK